MVTTGGCPLAMLNAAKQLARVKPALGLNARESRNNVPQHAVGHSMVKAESRELPRQRPNRHRQSIAGHTINDSSESLSGLH
jgi:hypothetical protein